MCDYISSLYIINTFVLKFIRLKLIFQSIWKRGLVSIFLVMLPFCVFIGLFIPNIFLGIYEYKAPFCAFVFTVSANFENTWIIFVCLIRPQ